MGWVTVSSLRSWLVACAVVWSMPLVDGSSTTDRGQVVTCRNVPTEMTSHVTGAGGFTATMKTSCSFDAGAKQFACTVRYSDSQGTTSESNTTATYNSVADVIDEIAVNPPLVYAVSLGASQSGSRAKSSGGVTNSFDGNRRITKTVNTSASGESTTTYTEWDAAGRPTRASDVGRGFSNVRAISYDDAARTKTTVVNGGPLRTVETFNADGNQIETLATSGGFSVASKTTITVNATQRVCK